MAANRWTLKRESLAATLRGQKLAVWADSPLAVLASARTEASHAQPLTLSGDLQRAIECLAQPRLELAMVLSPPYGLDLLWFYRGADRNADHLVGHVVEPDGDHLIVLAEEEEILAAMRESLQLDLPTEGGAFTLELRTIEFCTLVGLVDAHREWTLESLLERLPLPELRYDGRTICTALARSAPSGDRRWLGALAQALSPFELRLNEEQCSWGLGRLAQRGLLKEEKEGWSLLPSTQALCVAFSTPLAYCALHARRAAGPQQWVQEQISAVRCLSSLWLLEYLNLESQQPMVRLRAASSQEADLALSGRLVDWRRPASPAKEEKPARAGGRA